MSGPFETSSTAQHHIPVSSYPSDGQIASTSSHFVAMETSQKTATAMATVATAAVAPSVTIATPTYQHQHTVSSVTTSTPVPRNPSVSIATGVSHHPTRYLPTPDLSGSCERRSSKRSIKRKRFDDEVVESSLLKQDRPTRDRKGRALVFVRFLNEMDRYFFLRSEKS